MITKANSQSDLRKIHELAEEIWPYSYGEILSSDQIRFMLDQMYSVESLSNAVSEGQDFFIFHEKCKSVGFISMQKKHGSVDILRIEKLYVLPQMHGQGVGKKLIMYTESKAAEAQYKYLELNVNRNNPAFYFYKKVGFSVVDSIDIPYHGYVLNDYVMQKQILVKSE